MRLFCKLAAVAVSVAVTSVTPPVGRGQTAPAPAVSRAPAAFSWDNAVFYPILTDRFANGDPANDGAHNRPYYAVGTPSGAASGGGSDPAAALRFQGGDFRGIVEHIEDGYFANLGVSALRISPPFEQSHGFATTNAEPRYAFHGGWPIDFTEIDSAWGGSAGLRELLDAAHEAGIRVLIDINLNSAGPPTEADIRRFRFGPSSGGLPTASGAVDSAWAVWWGPSWVRANLPGYPSCGDEDVTACKGGLPDFRTEIGEPTAVPAFLLKKWGPEKSVSEQRELDDWFARTKHPRMPRHYLIKWMSDWVREYGVDGFFALDAGLVDVGLWSSLKPEAEQALADWRMAHGIAPRGATDFWLTGDAEPESPLADELFGRGFNALPVWLDARLLAADNLDSLYSARSAALATDVPRRLTARLQVGSAEVDHNLMTAFLLLPGSVALPFGLHFGPPEAAPAMLSEMGALALPSWAEVARFRSRHPAVGAGNHQPISAGPYTFQRTYRGGNVVDNVVVVMGAEGRTRVNVSGAFPDDAIVRDAITGSTGFVSFGYVSLTPDESGVLLLELAAQP